MDISLKHTYKGVLHPDSIRWCHGSVGLEHEKVRKFRYPLYKYSHTVDASRYRVVMCVCKNCNMTFPNDKRAPLSIPVKVIGNYTPYEVQVRVRGRLMALQGEIVSPFRKASIEEITDETRDFIEKVQ